MSDLRIGLDFGTSTTLVSIAGADEIARVQPLGRTTAWVPSLLGFDERGILLYGDEARHTRYPMRSIKHAITRGRDRVAPRMADGATVEIDVVEAAAGLLAHVADLSESAGIAIRANTVRLGCPAVWDGPSRNLLVEAARRAGLTSLVTEVLDEPIAAALAWAERTRARAGRLLVLDYGGGTLDIAVVNVRHELGVPRVTVLAARGSRQAGDALDHALADRLATDLRILGCDVAQLPDPAHANARLLDVATDLKVLLSAPGTDQLTGSLGPGYEDLPPVTLSVACLEEAFQAQLDETLSFVHATLCEAAIRQGWAPTTATLRNSSSDELAERIEIGTVLLAGGMSKIPAVARAIRKALPSVEHVESLDPGYGLLGAQESVVRGLAASPHRYESLNLSHPAVDFILEYEVGGQLITHTLYSAFEPLYDRHDALRSDNPASLCYRRSYRPQGLARDVIGLIVARDPTGKIHPLSLHKQTLSAAKVRVSRHYDLTLTLYVNGQIRINDGSYHQASYRVERWPMLDHAARRTIDLIQETESGDGGGYIDRTQDFWRRE